MTRSAGKKTFSIAAIALAAAILGGCGQCSICAVPSFSGTVVPPKANLHLALVGDDGDGLTDGITAIKLEDNAGNALPSPTSTLLPIVEAGDLDGQDLTPDGGHGTAIDGGNIVYFFTGANTNNLTLSPNTLDVSAFGGDGDSIATLPDGNEVVVSADGPTDLVVISGVLGGSAVLADTIPIPSCRDGIVISDDGRTLLARGSSGLTVFSIQTVPAHAGSLGGMVTHNYAQTADIPTAGRSSTTFDGRAGMAISTADFSRAVLIGSPTTSNVVSLVTGLPGSPVVQSIALRLPAATYIQPPRPRHGTRAEPHGVSGGGISIGGASSLFCVDISRDGTTAYVGTDAGIAVVGGVNTGALAQIGSVFSPQFTVGSSTFNLTNVRTLGVTIDGKYIAAFTPQPSFSSGTMLLLKVGAAGALSVVGQLNDVPIPANDQVLMH